MAYTHKVSACFKYKKRESVINSLTIPQKCNIILQCETSQPSKEKNLPCYTGEVDGAACVDVHLSSPYNLSLWLDNGQVDVVPNGRRRRHLTLVNTSITEMERIIYSNQSGMILDYKM